MELVAPAPVGSTHKVQHLISLHASLRGLQRKRHYLESFLELGPCFPELLSGACWFLI